MSEERRQLPTIKLAGMYENQSKAGKIYFAGYLGAAKIFMFRDERAEQGQPGWSLVIQEKEPKANGQGQRQGGQGQSYGQRAAQGQPQGQGQGYGQPAGGGYGQPAGQGQQGGYPPPNPPPPPQQGAPPPSDFDDDLPF